MLLSSNDADVFCQHAGWLLSVILIFVSILLLAFFIILPLRNGVSSWLIDILIQSL